MAKRQYLQRIYYGPPGNEMSMYWVAKVTDAKRPVVTNGNVLHALKGCKGVTVGCGLSNVAQDAANANAFPHPVLLASFTKSKAIIVTEFVPADKRRRRGFDCYAVRYSHSYRNVVNKNDEGTLKAMVKADPSIMERSFTLRPPRKGGYSSPGHSKHTKVAVRSKNTAVVHRGALARAVKAGLVDKPVADQLRSISKPKSSLDSAAKKALAEMQAKLI